MVLENTSNEITLVYSKAELSAPVDISFDLAGGAYNNSEEPVIVHAERGNRISETAIPTPVLRIRLTRKRLNSLYYYLALSFRKIWQVITIRRISSLQTAIHGMAQTGQEMI